MKIPGYRIYKVNYFENLNDGSAIAVKYKIKHKLYDDFDTDVLAIEVETGLGPIIIATTYLPPRRPYLPYPDIHKLLSNNISTYILGDFNARHTVFGNRDKNTVAKSLINLINQGKIIHLGPHFTTYHSNNASSSPDKIFSNKHHYQNCCNEPGDITTSDHLPIIFKLATIPFITEKLPTYNISKANWNQFHTKLDSQSIVSNFDGNTSEQIEHATQKWLNDVKKAMEVSIPRSFYKYQYQLRKTPEIRNLEVLFKHLKEHAELYGWTLQRYRKYLRIRKELREQCK